MLPRTARLNRLEFTTLNTSPALRVVFNRLGTLKYIPSPTSKLSVVVSSKHEKKAVTRNTLRRRLYALFGRQHPSIEAILYTSKQAYTFEYSEITTLFYDLCAKTQKASK